MTIAITGANGQLGQCFAHLSAHYPELNLVFADSQRVNITDQTAISDFFKQYKPDFCINCAAYTAVDKAESEPEKAAQINEQGARFLAEICKEFGTILLHFSTDYVYHSDNNLPLKETDRVSPKGVYARTKLAGDQAVLAVSSQNMVIRTSWVYSEFGHNFVKTIARLAKERFQLNVVFDQVGSPTYAPDLAKAVLDIVARVRAGKLQRKDMGGIWHYANEGACSWYDFAWNIVQIAQLDCLVLPIESKDYPTPAPRPPFSVLNKGKIKLAFGLAIPHWQESLYKCMQNL